MIQWDILSEFLGTLVLILLGNGVVASVSFKRMFGNQSGKWIVITMAWGFAVMCGVFVSSSLGGASHLNPAVTMMQLIADNSFGPLKAFLYILVQLLGAMVAQAILNFINWKHIKETDMGAVRGAHATGPAFENFGKDKALAQNLGYEYVGTMVLCGVIAAFSSKLNDGNATSIGVLPVTFLVMAIGMSLGSSTGYAINPARDLGPRIVYWLMTLTILKKYDNVVSANWSYGWVPVVAPLLGGATVGLIMMAIGDKNFTIA